MATALMATAPAAAKPQDNVILSEAQVEALGDWMTQLSDALTMATEGGGAVGQAKPLFAVAVRSPADAKTAVPKIRVLIAEGRRKVAQADARLVALKPLDVALYDGLTPARLAAEARAQIRDLDALLTDVDALSVAIEQNDRAAVGRFLPKLMAGASLLVEASRLMVRNRQAMIPTTDVNHQTLGILVQVYRATGAVFRAWVSSLDGPNEAAAAALRTELASVGQTVRSLGAIGRKNLSRQREEIAASGASPAEIALMQRVCDEDAKLFVVGDELAELSDMRVNAADLARAQSPDVLVRLKPLETRFQEITSVQIEIAAAAMR